MSWVKLDDRFRNHPKILEAVAIAGPTAGWWWACALAWCSDYATDGFIPKSAFETVAPGIRKHEDIEAIVGGLLTSGLLEESKGGVQIHDYKDWQPSADEVKAKRKATAERVTRWRETHTKRSCNSVTSPNETEFVRVSNALLTPPPSPSPSPSQKKEHTPRAYTREGAHEGPEPQAELPVANGSMNPSPPPAAGVPTRPDDSHATHATPPPPKSVPGPSSRRDVGTRRLESGFMVAAYERGYSRGFGAKFVLVRNDAPILDDAIDGHAGDEPREVWAERVGELFGRYVKSLAPEERRFHKGAKGLVAWLNEGHGALRKLAPPKPAPLPREPETQEQRDAVTRQGLAFLSSEPTNEGMVPRPPPEPVESVLASTLAKPGMAEINDLFLEMVRGE